MQSTTHLRTPHSASIGENYDRRRTHPDCFRPSQGRQSRGLSCPIMPWASHPGRPRSRSSRRWVRPEPSSSRSAFPTAIRWPMGRRSRLPPTRRSCRAPRSRIAWRWCGSCAPWGMTQPFCAMTYYNPLFSYGVQRFVADAAAAGIDGLDRAGSAARGGRGVGGSLSPRWPGHHLSAGAHQHRGAHSHP